MQMARGVRDGLEYAIKFFVTRAAFGVEKAMYARGSGAQANELAQFLPQVWQYSRFVGVSGV